MSEIKFPTEIPDVSPASNDRILFSDTSNSNELSDCTIDSLPIQSSVASALAGKQDTLVSGTNIKTVNGNSLLGSGDLILSGTGDVVGPSSAVDSDIVLFDTTTGKKIKDSGESITSLKNYSDGKVSDTAYDATSWNGVTSIAPSKNAVRDKIESMETEIGGKQDTLVSGTNIKTVNGSSLLGSGDLEITSGGGGGLAPVYLTNLTSTTNPSYKQTSYTPDATETIVSTVVNNNEVLAQTYIYDSDIGLTQINEGTWSFNLHAYVSSAVGVTKFRIETFKRTSGGTETTLFSVDSSEINATSQTLYQFQTTQGVFSCNTTDRLGTRVYVNTTAVINITASMVVGDGNATFFTTPLQIRASQVRNTPSGGISSTDVQGAINELDSEKVPTSRSLTINGTAYDLSADRSWTVTGGYEEIVFQDYAGTAVIGILGVWDCMNARTLSKIVLYADTLPVGSNVIAELRKNSTTSGNILNATLQLTTSDTASKGRYVGTAVTSFTSASVSANDVLYLYLTSVGSTTPAQNIRACLYYT